MLNRRTFVTALATTVVARPFVARAAEPLVLWGPPAAPSIVLAQAVADGLLKPTSTTAASASGSPTC